MEFTNVRGAPGWLESKVQKIAFHIKGEFKIVDREKLRIFANSFLNFENILGYKKYRCLYARPTKKDLVSYVFYKDIEHLVEETI